MDTGVAIEDLAREPAQVVSFVEKVSLVRDVMGGYCPVETMNLVRISIDACKTSN